jgi:hypothetical protein
MDVLYNLDGRRTFIMPDSLPQLTAVAKTYNYAYCWTWGSGFAANVLRDVSFA